MTSTHYNDMGSLSASSGQRTPNCVTSNSNLIFSICNFVHKQRQLWFFSPNSNSNNKHNHVSKFSRLHPPGQQTQNCVTSAAAVALLNDSAASDSTAAPPTYCSSKPQKKTHNTKNTQHKKTHMLLLLHTARQSHKNTKHTHPAATTYCSSNPHKNSQNIHMLLLKFSKISMLLQFVQIHTNSNLLKPSARLRAQKNPTSNPQSCCVQLLCYRGTHTNSIIANCTFIAHFEGTGS